jgi:hypothetical protein
VKRLSAVVLALVVPLAAGPAAQQKPNFSGDWKMNGVKSDFGAAPAPNTFARKIVHAEPSITIDEEQDTPIGVLRTLRKSTTDGTESTFNASGAEVTAMSKWDGTTLVLVSSLPVASKLQRSDDAVRRRQGPHERRPRRYAGRSGRREGGFREAVDPR